MFTCCAVEIEMRFKFSDKATAEKEQIIQKIYQNTFKKLRNSNSFSPLQFRNEQTF